MVGPDGAGIGLEPDRCIGIGEGPAQPFRLAVAAIRLEGRNNDRSEDDGYGGRSRNGVGKPDLVQIAAQGGEGVIGEQEGRAVVDVGGIDPDDRSIRPPEILIGRAVEEIVVEPFGKAIAVVDPAIERADQVYRRQSRLPEIGFGILDEEFFAEVAIVVPALVAEIGRGNCAAGGTEIMRMSSTRLRLTGLSSMTMSSSSRSTP